MTRPVTRPVTRVLNNPARSPYELAPYELALCGQARVEMFRVEMFRVDRAATLEDAGDGRLSISAAPSDAPPLTRPP